MNIVELARGYVAQNDVESGADALLLDMADEIERLRAELRMGLQHAEIERLKSELDLFQSIYCEISQIVGRQGTEAHTLAEDVRRSIKRSL